MRKYLIVCILFSLTSLGFSNSDSKKYWIFFKDKGINYSQIHYNLQKVQQELPDKTLKRRAKVLSANNIVDSSDLPIYQPYLNKIRGLHVVVITKSKWLNAVSAYLTIDELKQINKLLFVDKIVPVVIYKRRQKVASLDVNIPKTSSPDDRHQLLYGYSYTQNSMMNVPEVHDLGINGEGILIGILDSGFKHDEHEVFSSTDIVAEYDFINNDNVTKNEDRNNDSASQHNHGTKVLSVIGGFRSGILIGPAYKAKYLLGKTEYIPTETITEEDYWVSGLEWMEQNGADIVTSSLGYMDWYQYSDMDGNTAITTRAADIAVRKGVVVITSMGNEGNKSWIYMTAPADGKNVISVGAVTSSGSLSSFSSLGPTYDGRTKPDVVAMGTAVYAANLDKNNTYETVNGTSFSTPLTAGVAALILSAHPYLTPKQVGDALRNTASNSENPDNRYGWGIVNAYEAIFYHGFFFGQTPKIINDESGHKVQIKIFSRDNLDSDSLYLFYSINKGTYLKTELKPINRENIYEGLIPLQAENTEINFYFAVPDQSNSYRYHPYYAPAESFFVLANDTTITNPEEPEIIPSKYKLHQNFPNPFNGSTKILYEIETPGQVKISIFNIKGQLVRVLFEGFQINGKFEENWDGRNQANIDLTSGVYFYKLKSGSYIKTKKMLLLR